MSDPMQQESQPQVGSDAGLAALVEQYGEIKILYDEEDGFWLEWGRWKDTGGWEVMDDDLDKRYATPTDAINAAIAWHNQQAYNAWRKRIFRISANDEMTSTPKRSPKQ